jgi:hypothetical protein
MADEIELHYVAPGIPETVMTEWVQDRPAPLRDYELADESFNSLTFETHYYDWIWKFMFVVTFGVGWLFRDFAKSVFRVTANFHEDGGTRTKVTIVGRADPETRTGLGELAAQNGGAVGLQVGV